jgi:hypothetical protein
MLKIFEGANGYYVADENSDGFHHQPQDQGARLGFDRPAAQRKLTDDIQWLREADPNI